MPQWPATRVTLLDRIHDSQDQEAWTEFVGLYGPLVFIFARRRLPQDEDAADVVQEVLSAVLQGTYRRTTVRFQKWLVTVLLNKIRDFTPSAPGVAKSPVERPSQNSCWKNRRVATRRNGSRIGNGTCFKPPPSACGPAATPSTGTRLCGPLSPTNPARMLPALSTSL